MDKKKICALILLDLSKAFDSTSHERLLQKLFAVGASSATVSWFQSYLTGQTQSVRIDSTLSNLLLITHGGPQGAILSPLLFCPYVNGLPGAPQFCHLESYVDDSKVLLSIPVTYFNDAKLSLRRIYAKLPPSAVKTNCSSTLIKWSLCWLTPDNWRVVIQFISPSCFWEGVLHLSTQQETWE